MRAGLSFSQRQNLIGFAIIFTGYICSPQENPLLSAGVSPCAAPKGGLKVLRAFLYPRSFVSDKPDLLDYILKAIENSGSPPEGKHIYPPKDSAKTDQVLSMIRNSQLRGVYIKRKRSPYGKTSI